MELVATKLPITCGPGTLCRAPPMRTSIFGISTTRGTSPASETATADGSLALETARWCSDRSTQKSCEDLGQLRGHLAIVDRRAPAAQPALQGHAALRSRGENQVEAVPVLDLFPVVFRKRDVVVGRVLNSGGLML